MLGEQSAKQLRGEKMQNVVFGGTKTRKPLGMAEVSLVFANNQGRLPVAYEEVRLTRRLTRDGQSDYFLNGAPCRLKDIKDLITDTGAGSHAYSIIEREMVDSVIKDHEESRRFLFEEASGIMKYRMRRKEALRKLDLTEQDLLRLNDIIDEIARTVRSLKRQMGRARRYQELQEQLRKCETSLAQKRLVEYRNEAAALQSLLEGLRAEGVGDDATGDAIEAHIEALRTVLVDQEREYRAAGERVEDVARRLKSSEDGILVLRERTDSTREGRAAAAAEIAVTDQRLAQVRNDRGRLEGEHAAFESRLTLERDAFQARKDQLAACEQHHENARAELLVVKQRSFDFAQDSVARRGELDLVRAKLEAQEARFRELSEELAVEAARIARLTEEHTGVGRRIEASDATVLARREAARAMEAEIEQVQDRIERRREERADLGSRLEATRSKHELLQAMIDAYEGYGEGARALLQRHAPAGCVLGTLAERVQAPEGLESAFDALLHDVVDALLVRDVDGAVGLVQELRTDKLGRATLVLPDVPGAGASRLPEDLASRPGVIGRAVDLLNGGAEPFLRRLLANAVVVEDVPAALEVLHACDDPTLRVATRDGLLLTGAGAVAGGVDREREVRLLGRRRRLDELAEEMRVVSQEMAQVVESLGGLDAGLVSCREQRLQLEAAARAEEANRNELSVARAQLETSIAEASARRAQAGVLHAQVDTERGSLAGLLPDLASDAERLGREQGEHGRTLADRETAFATLDRDREQLRHEVGEARVAYVTLQGELESHARQLERLSELERELHDIGLRRSDEIARAERDLDRYASELETLTGQAGEMAAELDTTRSGHNELGIVLDQQRTAIDAEQARLHEIEKVRREAQGRRHQSEMGLAECTMRRQNLLDRVAENYGLDEDALLGLRFEWTDSDPVPDDQVVRELKEEIARLGPVNLLALEEHEEKAARLEFLEAQREDLNQASQSLHETIDRINRTAQFLFVETYEQVREHFRETIRTVFDGGEGDLILENPEDPLESDIDIRVRPRGKKIDTLTQLSSGERALTAIALLFSIYLVKPSPFCVFDEVDAPLDDANIGRFVNLLQEFKNRTQFIVITHNKLTMEAADRLYGVTMEEEGVSKLVSVALDGELKGEPKALKKKTQRQARAAALLSPTGEAMAGLAAGAVLDTSDPESVTLGPRRAAARLDRSFLEESPGDSAATAVLEVSPESDPAPEAHPEA